MSEKPNLLFMMTDQQAANTLPSYGNETIDTPNLDALARRGTTFQNPYCTKPLCSPSRSALMTGQYPHTSGVFQNYIPLPSDAQCLPELANLDDYVTCYIGKWHLGDEIFAQHGFDEWIATEYRHDSWSADRPRDATPAYHDYLIDQGYEPNRERDDGREWFYRGYVNETVPEEHSAPAFMADRAIEFIEDHLDEPFLLVMSFTEPHGPFTSARNDQYDPEEVELPPNYTHDGMDEQVDTVRYFRKLSNETDLIGHPSTREEWKERIAIMYGMISLVDTHIGRVLETVSDHDLSSETITAFTSDHGAMMGSHQIPGKLSFFDEATKVPLFLHIPDIDCTGEIIENPISHIDLLPTLLDALGQPIPDHLQGHSWLPYLQDETELIEEYVFIEQNNAAFAGTSLIHSVSDVRSSDSNIPEINPVAQEIWDDMDTQQDLIKMITDPVRAVVTPDGWKFVYRRSGQHELYNLDDDPYETENLANKRQDLVDTLYDRILDWQIRTRDPVPL